MQVNRLQATITRDLYTTLSLLGGQVHDEVFYKYYRQGKGKPGSPAKALRMYGFKSKPKKKLLKELAFYLRNVEVIEVHNAYTRDISELM
jgi:hypothetical protein